jgi:hypothetical protein
VGAAQKRQAVVSAERRLSDTQAKDGARHDAQTAGCVLPSRHRNRKARRCPRDFRMEPSIRQPVVDIAMELSDLQVHVYTNSASAAGSKALKGTYKGQHISGKYRFTDTWVKRNGKWQLVASQATKAQEGVPGRKQPLSISWLYLWEVPTIRSQPVRPPQPRPALAAGVHARSRKSTPGARKKPCNAGRMISR